MSQNAWTEVFRAKASVYALDEYTKQWADRGTSGTVIMYQNNHRPKDVRIKWEKNSTHRILWWRLTSSKLKAKGERALVLKAWATTNNEQEILAIRFGDQKAAKYFGSTYHNIFPSVIPPQLPEPSNKSKHKNNFHEPHNGQYAGLAKLSVNHHASMASLPGSVGGFDDDDQHIKQFQPQQNNYNHNNHWNNGGPPPVPFDAINKKHKPPPPPNLKMNKKLPHKNKSFINNGQVVNPAVMGNMGNMGGGLPKLNDIDNQFQSKVLPPHPNQQPSKAPVKALPNMKPPTFNKNPPQQNNNGFMNNNNNQFQMNNGFGNNMNNNNMNGNMNNMMNNMNNMNNNMMNNNGFGMNNMNGMNNGFNNHNHNQNNNGNPSWRCSVCTYQNAVSHNNCQMCGNKPNGINNGHNMNGMNNGNQNIKQNGNHQRQDSSITKWRCSACTFSNHSWTNRCEICSAKRKFGKDDPKHNGMALKSKADALSLHNDMSNLIQKQFGDNNIGSPVYNQIPQKRAFDFGGIGSDDDMMNDNRNRPWSCPICTLSNSFRNARCEACNTARNINPYNGYNGGNNNGGNLPNPNPLLQDNSVVANNGSGVDDYDDYRQQLQSSYYGGGQQQQFQHDYLNPNNDLFESTVEDFSRAASDIACYNDVPSSVFSTLRSVAKKLLKNDPRYRTLDTTNPKVMERLIGFEGVLDFLMLLGFESDAMGMKLVCHNKPSSFVVKNAITVLNLYQQRFRMTPGGINSMQQNNGALSPKGGNDDAVTLGGFSDVDPSVLAADKNNQQNNQNKNDILTLEQIILWSTHENMQDNDTMETLIMTHKTFTESITLLKQLRKRFFVPIPPDILNGVNNIDASGNITDKNSLIRQFQSTIQKRIQLKVIKALRDWMKHYWDEDFLNNNEMQNELSEWLKELSVYRDLDPLNQNCTWIEPLYKTVKNEFLRLKEIDWAAEHEKRKLELSLLDRLNDQNISVPKKFSIVTAVSAEDLADQITLMDYYLFSKIEPRECVHQRWKVKIDDDDDDKDDKDKPDDDIIEPKPNTILSLIKQFNNFTIFIQVMILRENSLKRRSLAIRRFIKMGEHFRLSRNYNSLCAVFSALNSAAIHRLRLAWKRIPDRSIQQFEFWSQIFSRDFNHRNYRALLRKSGGNPCIPHIGVFLQDIIFIDEGNKGKNEIANFNNNKMLNFNKCVRIADRIKNLQLFQNHPYTKLLQIQNNYNNKNNNSKNNQKNILKIAQKMLLEEFDKLKNVTEDQIWDMSTEIKKNDQKEARQAFNFGFGNRNNPNQLPKLPNQL